MSDALHISTPNSGHNELSQARLAAEAAFLPPRPMIDAHDGPVIVVKRKKAVMADGGHSPSEDTEHSGKSRSPKIYRVEHGPNFAASDSSVEPIETTGSLNFHDETSGQPVAPPKRRRRIKRHGEVTIIHPQASERVGERVPAAGIEESVATSVEPICTEKFVQEIAALKRRALADLASVQSEIRKLERQAEAVRKVEATQAVRWIRKAMAEYDLELADLGL